MMTEKLDALRELLASVEAGEWRPTPDFSRYMISERGAVWNTHSARVIAQNPCERGYPMVHVYDDAGHRKTRKVHVLVASAFLGPRPKGQEVRHLNGDKADPSRGNLAYGTRSENLYDRKRHDLPYSYRLKPSDVMDIKARLAGGERQTSIAAAYGVHRCTIGDIFRGKRHADI